MKKRFEYLRVVQENGKYRLFDPTGKEQKDIYVRDIMCEKAVLNGQCIQYDIETGRSYRKDMAMFNEAMPKEQEVEASNKIETDPILNFIHNNIFNIMYTSNDYIIHYIFINILKT